MRDAIENECEMRDGMDTHELHWIQHLNHLDKALVSFFTKLHLLLCCIFQFLKRFLLILFSELFATDRSQASWRNSIVG